MLIQRWEHSEKGVADRQMSSENLISAAMKQAAPYTCFFIVFFILGNLWGYITDLSKYHNAGIWSMD